MTATAQARTPVSFPNLFSPLNVGPRTFKNRIYSPPHFPGFIGGGFMPTQRLIDYLEAKARGGAAAIATGVTPVHRPLAPFGQPDFLAIYGPGADTENPPGAAFTLQAAPPCHAWGRRTERGSRPAM